MRKTIILLAVLASLFPSLTGAAPPGGLRKYLQPANITTLDWLLLKAEVSSFARDIRWDEYALVDSVSLYAINQRGLVGMTFLVNKDRFIAVPDAIAKKVFADVVLQACKILKHSIPEVEGAINVYANFVVVRGDVVATFKQGQVSLESR